MPIYRLSQDSFDNKTLWFETKKADEDLWIKTNLFFNLRSNHNKSKYDKKSFANIISKYGDYMLECPLMIESEFVSMYTLKEILEINEINDIKQDCTHYMFNPILVDQNESYSINVFTEIKRLDKNYGDYLPENRKLEDIDFIYVDPYNMKKLMGNEWQPRWMSNFYSQQLYAKFLNKIHLKIYFGELYKNELGESPAHSNLYKINNVYIKRRILFNDNQNERVYLRDLYLPIKDFYAHEYTPNGDIFSLTED